MLISRELLGAWYKTKKISGWGAGSKRNEDSNVNASYAIYYVMEPVGDKLLRHRWLDKFELATSSTSHHFFFSFDSRPISFIYYFYKRDNIQKVSAERSSYPISFINASNLHFYCVCYRRNKIITIFL